MAELPSVRGDCVDVSALASVLVGVAVVPAPEEEGDSVVWLALEVGGPGCELLLLTSVVLGTSPVDSVAEGETVLSGVLSLEQADNAATSSGQIMGRIFTPQL
jgi:hypothetical protein